MGKVNVQTDTVKQVCDQLGSDRFGDPDDHPSHHGSGEAPHSSQDDDDEREQGKRGSDVRGKGHQRHEESAGSAHAGRSDAKADGIDPVDIGADEERAHPVVCSGSNGFPRVGLFQEEQHGDRNDDGQGEGEESRHIDHHISEGQRAEGKPAPGTDVVRSPDDPGAVFEDHSHPHKREDLHGLGKVNDPVDDRSLEDVSEKKEAGRTDEEGEERINPCPVEKGIGDVHPPDHHLPVGEVDDLHHAKNEGEA